MAASSSHFLSSQDKAGGLRKRKAILNTVIDVTQRVKTSTLRRLPLVLGQSLNSKYSRPPTAYLHERAPAQPHSKARAQHREGRRVSHSYMVVRHPKRVISTSDHYSTSTSRTSRRSPIPRWKASPSNDRAALQGLLSVEPRLDVSEVYFPVTAVSGHELDPGAASDVARALAVVDHAILLFLWEGSSSVQEAGRASGQCRAIDNTLRALEDGLSGREAFHRLYLRSLGFEPYWERARAACQARRPGGAMPGTTGNPRPPWEARTRTAFKVVENHAERLREAVVENGSLYLQENTALRRPIQRRWQLLVDILDAVYCGSETSRVISEWDGFFPLEDTPTSAVEADGFSTQLSMELGDTHQAPVIETPPGGRAIGAFRRQSRTSPVVFSNYVTNILWLTFLAAVPLSIVAFALALKYSEPAPGTTTDGDFWLLFQSCGMQLVSLASVVAPVWGGRVVTGHARVALLVSIGVAGASTVMAPFCYVRLPKAWSGFVVVISGCINAFATLQLALAMHRGKEKA